MNLLHFSASGGNPARTGCPHMRGLLSLLSDGTLCHGILHWYTVKHVELCPCCYKALDSLRNLGAELQALKTPSAERQTDRLDASDWDRIESAWDEIDRSDVSS